MPYINQTLNIGLPSVHNPSMQYSESEQSEEELHAKYSNSIGKKTLDKTLSYLSCAILFL